MKYIIFRMQHKFNIYYFYWVSGHINLYIVTYNGLTYIGLWIVTRDLSFSFMLNWPMTYNTGWSLNFQYKRPFLDGLPNCCVLHYYYPWFCKFFQLFTRSFHLYRLNVNIEILFQAGCQQLVILFFYVTCFESINQFYIIRSFHLYGLNVNIEIRVRVLNQ